MTNERWEYKVVECKPNRAWLSFSGSSNAEETQLELNRLGQQGWELVSAIQLQSMLPMRLFLKRAL